MKSFYNLPCDLEKDIEIYASELEGFLKGDLHPTQFRAKRVPRGVYEQRTDNTYMMRVRLPAGGITPEQMKKVSVLSKQFGNGILHVTTRQDIQLHWIKLEDTPEVMKELMQVGLTTKGGGGNTVRNITACYDSGVCSKEVFDVSPYAIALTEHLIKDQKSYTLPRKYKLSFSGCSSDCSYATVNDLGFIAKERVKNGTKDFGFKVYVAGGMGGHSRVAEELEEFIPIDEIRYVADAVKMLFDQHGNRKNKHKARLRFLFERLGREEFIKLYKVELEKIKKGSAVSLEFRDLTHIPDKEDTSDITDSEIDRTEEFKKWKLINAVKQRQGDYYYVMICLPLGDIDSFQLNSLSGVIKNYGEGTIRLTHDQNLCLRWVHKNRLTALFNDLKKINLNKAGASSIIDTMCCAGASTCRLGICLSRGLGTQISKELSVDSNILLKAKDLNIKISGCPNSCGHHPIGKIGLFGAARREGNKVAPCYLVSVGGRVEEGKTVLGEVIGLVPSKNAPRLILKFIKDYCENGEDDFYSYIENGGRETMINLIKEFEYLPSFNENSDYYYDWGSNEEFSLAGRGAGECGAGVFDMIEVDIKESQNFVNKAEKLIRENKIPGKYLYEAINRSSKALLVTRGAEADNDIKAFELFEEHFINTKLVDQKFRKLIFMATEFKNGNLKEDALKDNFDLIKGLTEAIAALYKSMDDSLQFKLDNTYKDKEIAPSTPDHQKERSKLMDLRGVQCPFNYVKAKIQLETMGVGDNLELFLDDGEPIRNVPNSLKNDGQEILEMEQQKEGHFRLLIKKKV